MRRTRRDSERAPRPDGWSALRGRRPLAGLVVLLVACSTAPIPLHAQSSHAAPDDSARTRPLLWRLGPPATASYLFGTIHVADPRVLATLDDIEAAFTACDGLRTEIPLDAAALIEVQAGMLLPDDTTLRDVLPAPTLQRLQNFLDARHQSFDSMAHLKPWVLASLLSMMDSPALFDMPLDQHLHERALDHGMSTGGLETVAEQLEILDSMPAASAAVLLEETLDELESGENVIEPLLVAYLQGDAETLLELVAQLEKSSDPQVRSTMERLLDARNVLLAERIAALMQQSPETRWFFAVGAGHLAGEGGVVARLRRLGIPIVRVEE